MPAAGGLPGSGPTRECISDERGSNMNQAVSRKPETAKTNGRLNSADSAFWHNRISLFRIYLAKLTATELGIHVTVIMEAGYAFDATVIDLCLSLFPWAHSRSTKAAIKLNPLLD